MVPNLFGGGKNEEKSEGCEATRKRDGPVPIAIGSYRKRSKKSDRVLE